MYNAMSEAIAAYDEMLDEAWVIAKGIDTYNLEDDAELP